MTGTPRSEIDGTHKREESGKIEVDGKREREEEGVQDEEYSSEKSGQWRERGRGIVPRKED